MITRYFLLATLLGAAASWVGFLIGMRNASVLRNCEVIAESYTIDDHTFKVSRCDDHFYKLEKLEYSRHF